MQITNKLFFFLTVALLGVSTACKTTSNAPSAQASAISLGVVEGVVKVNGAVAQAGLALKSGDSIEASGEAFADIYYNDGSKVRIANGRAAIGATTKGIALRLIVGKLYSWISPGTSYEVNTTTAVAGVRGTKFFTEVKESKTYFCVCEGSIWTRPALAKDAAETVVKAGQDLYVLADANESDPVDSPGMVDMLNPVFDDMAARTAK